MTGVHVFLTLVAFAAGLAVAGVAFLFFAHTQYQRGVLDGQRQAELTHTGWHPALADGFNVREPKHRRRSPDRQIVPEQPKNVERPLLNHR
jgi:hypothetical protein